MGWIKRILRHDLAWTKLLQARCHPFKLADLLKCRYVKKDLDKFNLLPFYHDLLVGYRGVNKLETPTDATQVRREYLWLNEFIKCDGGAIFEKHMYACGIKNIDDLADCTGTFLSYTCFKQKYPNCRTSFLRYLGIISAIPRRWKEMVRQYGGCPMDVSERNGVPYMRQNNKRIPITTISTRQLYNTIKPDVIPTATQRWEYQGLVPDNWAEVFYIPYSCTASTKLQSFQYQLLHRYLPTRKFLHVRGLVDSANCLRCVSADTLVHYLFTCHPTRDYWNKVFNFINSHVRPTRVMCNVRNVIFGVPDAPPIVNLMILCGKHYLHMRKAKGQTLVFEMLKSYLKSVYETEKHVARVCPKKKRAWSVKWLSFRDVFEN